LYFVPVMTKEVVGVFVRFSISNFLAMTAVKSAQKGHEVCMTDVRMCLQGRADGRWRATLASTAWASVSMQTLLPDSAAAPPFTRLPAFPPSQPSTSSPEQHTSLRLSSGPLHTHNASTHFANCTAQQTATAQQTNGTVVNCKRQLTQTARRQLLGMCHLHSRSAPQPVLCVDPDPGGTPGPQPADQPSLGHRPSTGLLPSDATSTSSSGGCGNQHIASASVTEPAALQVTSRPWPGEADSQTGRRPVDGATTAAAGANAVRDRVHQHATRDQLHGQNRQEQSEPTHSSCGPDHSLLSSTPAIRIITIITIITIAAE
jgi:hypothetical protein